MKLPAACSLPVIDSISIRARVSAKTSINRTKGGGQREGKTPGRPARFVHDSAPPAGETGDSEPVLTRLPNRMGLSFPDQFRRNLPAPFTRASEAQSECQPGYSWPPHLYRENLRISKGRRASQIQGRTPATFSLIRYRPVRAVMYSVFPSVSPQAQFAGISGS